jgi:hypothetical protein
MQEAMQELAGGENETARGTTRQAGERRRSGQGNDVGRMKGQGVNLKRDVERGKEREGRGDGKGWEEGERRWREGERDGWRRRLQQRHTHSMSPRFSLPKTGGRRGGGRGGGLVAADYILISKIPWS